MIQLRIVAPADRAEQVLGLLDEASSACNVVHLPGAVRDPNGDLIYADLPREDVSVILGDLKELDIPRVGSVALEDIDTMLSEQAEHAERDSAGLSSDAVIWEEVEARTSEQTELSVSFVAFMVLAMQIAMAGIALDSPILIVGAMVVGPEFGPIAGFCVALVDRRRDLASASGKALLVGFAVGIGLTMLSTLALHAVGTIPDEIEGRQLTGFISRPNEWSVIVAGLAGCAGMLSLSTAKSGALIGVLISVTTIPAGANVGLAAALGDWSECGGAALQLGVNLITIFTAGLLTLFVQRLYYLRRRKKHMNDPARAAAGLPEGRATHPNRER